MVVEEVEDITTLLLSLYQLEEVLFMVEEVVDVEVVLQQVMLVLQQVMEVLQEVMLLVEVVLLEQQVQHLQQELLVQMELVNYVDQVEVEEVVKPLLVLVLTEVLVELVGVEVEEVV
jgi:hypothetical protein